MDDIGDPCWSWPHWKFGLKRADLFTKLHDQYNTFPSTIQDPEAFHHDVYEISNAAATSDEFHRLLQDRKQKRLRELNESLESAAFEIIGNPSLIGTDQWQHAVQLFRTKSLDSLVRYFASYLPNDHPWHQPSETSSVTSSDEYSCPDSQDAFDDDFDGPIMTEEPELYQTTNTYPTHLPPSPRSMTMCSDSSAASPVDHSHDDFLMTPTRTLSFSESEPDCFPSQESHPLSLEEKINELQPCEEDTPETSVSDMSDIVASNSPDRDASKATESMEIGGASTTQPTVIDSTESETPTPKPERTSAPFFENAKPILPHRRHRSVSPSRPHSLSEYDAHLLVAHRDPRNTEHAQCARLSRLRWEESGSVRRRRRSPGEPATRVQKALVDGGRSARRGRRRAAES